MLSQGRMTILAAMTGRMTHFLKKHLTGPAGPANHNHRITGSPDHRITGSPDHRITGSPDHRITGRRHILPALTFAVMVLALAGTVPDARAQQNEVYFATDTIHVIPGEKLQVTPTLRYVESTNVAVHIRTVEPTGNLDGYEPARLGYAHDSGSDFTPSNDRRGALITPGNDQFEAPVPVTILTGATPPAMGKRGKYFYFEITKVTTDGRPNSSNIHPRVTIGTPHRLTVFIDHMPQIVLSQEHFTVDEPKDDSCSDSHVGDEKIFTDITLRDGAAGVRTVRDYGPVLTTVPYKVSLNRPPGPGKVVSVEIWEPTDLDRPDVRRFHENARIHGIGWPPIRQGRISIDNSPVLNQGQPVGDGSRRHLNTYLTFTNKNWDQPKTVTVNIHCAQHDVTTPLPIWHFAFRHNTPGWGYPSYMYNRKGDNSRENTSLKIAQVRVADSTEPDKITGNPRGNLVLDPDVSGHFVLSDDGEDGYAHIIGLDFRWNNPDNSHHNDYDDANEKFAGFRVRFRTVDPPGHAVQEKFVRADFIIPGDAPTTASWRAALEANGYDHAKRFAPNRPNRKYEWSVVPVDRHWNNVEAERVTRCVMMTGNTLDLTANPICPAPLQGEGASAPALSVPDTAVSNLQLAVVDDASASVTWDAVEHATSYDVSWEASGSQTAITGTESVTGTTATIQHNAQEAMTLTLTVTPEYLDENGAVQQLDALAATATLEIGPQSDALRASAESQPPACVSDALLSEVRTAAGETWRSPGHVERWSRVLAAFGEENSYSNNPMTIAEAQAQADRGLKRWAPVAPALECLANPPQETPQQEEEEEETVTPTTPELSLSAGSAITEGEAASFTVTADPAPSSDITIAYSVTETGDFLDAPGAGSRTVTLAAGTTSTTLTVATVDDSANEEDGSVTVTIDTASGYTIATGKGSGAVAALDNDKPVVSITAGPGVAEGIDTAFTITADPVPAAPLDVALTITQSGDMAASGQIGSRTVTIPAAGTATFSVTTEDDSTDEPDGTITATIDTGTGYSIGSPAAATVTVTDNDAATPSTGPTISIADATMNENQHNGWFTVTLSEKVAWPVHVYYATRDSNPVSAVAGEDYLAWKRSWRLRARFRPGQTETKIHVPLYNDSHDEDPETFEMVLFDAGVNGPPDVSVSIADGVAVGTITNSDPMPAAFLSRFGRTVAQQALDGIENRLAADRSPATSATIAGQALALGTASHVAEGLQGQDLQARALLETDPFDKTGPEPLSMTAREALLASSFTTTGETASGSLAIWGRAARDSFDGQEGTFSLDGTATTAMLGADYARDRWLIGLALLQSSGKGSYVDTDVMPRPDTQICPPAEAGQVPCGEAIRAGDGKVEASLTAVLPYASMQVSERLRFWGALGHGTGEVTLKPETGGTLTADTSWQMAAAGIRAELTAIGSGTLSLTSDALWSRTRSEKTHELAASDATVTRLRAGMEASWQIGLASGAMLTPGLEAGVRHDGGDAEQGAGIELGASLAFRDPASGFAMDLSARKLIAHDDDEFEENGLAASFIFDPRPDSARGLSVSLRQDAGKATGGVDTLFMPQALERQDTGSTATTAEAAYGLAALAGRFTIAPHARLRMDDASRDTTLGLRLTPERGAPDLSLGLEATRREHGAAAPVHGVGVGVTLRW